MLLWRAANGEVEDPILKIKGEARSVVECEPVFADDGAERKVQTELSRQITDADTIGTALAIGPIY